MRATLAVQVTAVHSRAAGVLSLRGRDRVCLLLVYHRVRWGLHWFVPLEVHQHDVIQTRIRACSCPVLHLVRAAPPLSLWPCLQAHELVLHSFLPRHIVGQIIFGSASACVRTSVPFGIAYPLTAPVFAGGQHATSVQLCEVPVDDVLGNSYRFRALCCSVLLHGQVRGPACRSGSQS